MSKAFFRWLRGELNGFYLTSINGAMNDYTKFLQKFFIDFDSQQFELDKIDTETLYSIGKIAGIYLPRLSSSDTLTSIRMTESNVNDDGFETSERGLFSPTYENFTFYHTDDDTRCYFKFLTGLTSDINNSTTDINRSSLVGDEEVLGYISESESSLFDSKGNLDTSKLLSSPPEGLAYTEWYGDRFLLLSEGDDSEEDNLLRIRMTDSAITDDVEYSERGLFLIPVPVYSDINELATSTQRSSLVGNEEVIGYISSEEENVLSDSGEVLSSAILSSPPANVAYSEYYGSSFLFLSEANETQSDISPSLFIELFKAIQWINYNGLSVSTLCQIIELICPDGFITVNSIESASDGKHLNVHYTYNENANVTLKQQRYSLLQYLLAMKFPQVVLVETSDTTE